jgi:hypothetical protein
MGDIIKLNKKPEKHLMKSRIEGKWVIWECEICGRRVKDEVASDNDPIFEIEGNLLATHLYECPNGECGIRIDSFIWD